MAVLKTALNLSLVFLDRFFLFCSHPNINVYSLTYIARLLFHGDRKKGLIMENLNDANQHYHLKI